MLMTSLRAARLAAALATVGALALVAGCADPSAGGATGQAAAAGAAAAKPAGPAPLPRPQDDMYRATNGAWLAANEIPADRASRGAFLQLRDEAVTQLKSVIDDAEAIDPKGTADQKKIAALFESFMDEDRLE